MQIRQAKYCTKPQQTIHSSDRLYKAQKNTQRHKILTKYWQTNRNIQTHVFVHETCLQQKWKRCRPTATSKHALGLLILTKYWRILIIIGILIIYISSLTLLVLSISIILKPYWCPIDALLMPYGTYLRYCKRTWIHRVPAPGHWSKCCASMDASRYFRIIYEARGVFRLHIRIGKYVF